MNLTQALQAFADCWKNENEYNQDFHARCTKMVDESKFLKEHRDWVEENQYGFGDRAFHCIWIALVEQMPADFSFLEIGVFKGQVLSLVGALAKYMEKKAAIYGVTTLTNTEDVRCRYPVGDYRQWIDGIHRKFNVPLPTLIVGKSNDETVVEQCNGFAPFDACYIDGSHDYHDVVFDIKTYAPMTKLGGILAMDDSSNLLKIGTCWPGLEAVSEAVRDHLEPDDRFRHLFACGHLRLFQRIKE